MAPTHSAFFYGTLMAPQVLHRVCHGDPNAPSTTHNLTTTPALLQAHRRHRVKHADYPAILPHPTSSVLGVYVTGLTPDDIFRLDIFEGSEYARRKVKVQLLPPDETTQQQKQQNAQVKLADDSIREAETYIWIAGEQQLEESEWDFDEFRREKMRFWVGSEGEGEYAEVDEAVAEANKQIDGTRGRAANGGHITSALNDEHKKSDA